MPSPCETLPKGGKMVIRDCNPGLLHSRYATAQKTQVTWASIISLSHPLSHTTLGKRSLPSEFVLSRDFVQIRVLTLARLRPLGV